MEEHESDIEDWYFKSQGEVSLKTFLCSQLVLKDGDDSCLAEVELPKVTNGNAKAEDSTVHKPNSDVSSDQIKAKITQSKSKVKQLKSDPTNKDEL